MSPDMAPLLDWLPGEWPLRIGALLFVAQKAINVAAACARPPAPGSRWTVPFLALQALADNYREAENRRQIGSTAVPVPRGQQQVVAALARGAGIPVLTGQLAAVPRERAGPALPSQPVTFQGRPTRAAFFIGADPMSLSSVPALEALIEKSLGKSDTAAVSADIALAGTVVQMVAGALIARLDPGEVSALDAGVTQVLSGITAIETALRPASTPVTPASEG